MPRSSERLDELLDFANVRDANGHYLFAGFKGDTRPFTHERRECACTAAIRASASCRSPTTRRVQVGDSGDRVFMRVPGGNGRFSVSADAANTGAGTMAAGSVTDPSAFTGDGYSVRFTAPGTFDVVNDTLGVTVLAAQAYGDGATIAFDGIDTRITGQPAAGDRFDITAGGAKPIFDTLSDFVDCHAVRYLERPPRGRKLDQTMNGIIDSLDQALNHVLEVRTTVGARRNAVESVGVQNEDLEFELRSTLAEVQGLDHDRGHLLAAAAHRRAGSGAGELRRRLAAVAVRLPALI